MKILKLTLAGMIALPICAFANWQFTPLKSANSVSATKATKDSGFKQVKNPAVKFIEPWKNAVNMPAEFGTIANNYQPYRFKLYPGSLKDNLTRIMMHSRYKMIWRTKYDYYVVGKTIITAKTFNDALRTLLKNYPIRAVFYTKNHIMTIIPRKNS